MMFAPHRLAPDVWTAPQISVSDVGEAARMGVRLIVNNRPDDEDPGQPPSAVIEAAARAAGLAYLHAPIIGFPEPDTVAKISAALENGQPTLMYCRSGTRSTIVWALAMRALARAEPEELRAAAAAAGYDLSRLPL